MSSRRPIRVIRPANIVTTVSARSTISSSSVDAKMTQAPVDAAWRMRL